MTSADASDQGRQKAASPRSPQLILACSIRGRVHALVAACRDLEQNHVHRIEEPR